MNANVGENNIVAENTIVEQELKEKTDVRKAVYGVFKRIIDILGGFVGVILLIPVTIGNILGGAIFVAGIYYFLFVNKKENSIAEKKTA